jgi:hypothetical protein
MCAKHHCRDKTNENKVCGTEDGWEMRTAHRNFVEKIEVKQEGIRMNGKMPRK